MRQSGKIVGLSALIVLLVGGVASAQGGIGGRPAKSDPDNPRTQSIFIYTLEKGQSRTDKVLISNSTDQEQTIELLAVDGTVTNTGAYTCKQNSEEKIGLGSGIELREDSVVLGAGEDKEVDFTVTMPQDADVGEHNACLVFQSPQEAGEAEGSVRVRTRQAIRVVATVPGDLKREIQIENFAITQGDDSNDFAISIKNTGNVSTDVESKVYLKNLFGAIVYKDGGQYPVLANQKLDMMFSQSDRPLLGGWYKAGASASYDKRAGVFGLADDGQIATESTDESMIFLPPTSLGGVIIAMVGLVVLAAVAVPLIARYRKKDDISKWSQYTVQSGDSIQSVADAHQIDWKKLANRNDIKAPYNLKPGGTILVPSSSASSEPRTDQH